MFKVITAKTPVLLPGKSCRRRSLEGCSPWGRYELETTERLHFHFHALEKEMATHSNVRAWRIPGTGEPGGLPSLGSHRVGHTWSDLAAAASAVAWAWKGKLWEMFTHLFKKRKLLICFYGPVELMNIKLSCL